MADTAELVATGLDQLSEGFAIFDEDLKLVSCNRPFQELRNYPGALCQPGTSLEAMIRFNAERGDFGPGAVGDHVAERMAEIAEADHREIEREMADGQVLKIRYQHFESGGLTVTFEDKTDERRAQAALGASEERYALVSEAAEEAVYEWDIANDRFFSSPRLTALLGIETGEHGIRNWRWEDKIHPDDRERYQATLAAHRSGIEARWDCEYRIVDRAGAYRWISDHGTSVRDGTGAAVRMVAAVRDITDRVERDAALAASEERHTLVTRATSDGLYDWDVARDVLFVSERLNQLFAFEAGELTSRTWVARVHEDDVDTYADAIRAHFKGDTPHLECEYRIRVKGGDFRWVRDHGIGVRGDDGRVKRLVGAVRDITDIREVEAELGRTETRLLDSLESLSDGFLLVDAENRVQLWNSRYLEIFGDAAGGDISGMVTRDRPFFDMIRDGYERGMFPPQPDGCEGWVARRREAWKNPDAELEIQLNNGRWILINERRMSDGGRVAVYSDITELKRRQEESDAARARFEEAIEAVSSGFALFDSEDRIVVCNSKYRDYFPELVDMVTPGTAFRDLINAAVERGLLPLAADDPEGFLAAVLEKRVGDGRVREQYMRDGLWLQISDHSTKDGGLVSIYTDVTDLKSREQELRTQSAILEATIDTIEYGVIFMGPDLRARMINRAFGRMWGMPQEFIDGSPTMQELIEYNRDTGIYDVAPEDWDEWIEGRVEAVREGTTVPAELRRADGMVLQHQCISLPDGGKMLTYFDITELKKREVDHITAKHAAEQALRDLQQAQDRLVQAEKMASLGQLTAGIAHEIKNPLNFINNFAMLSVELLAELNDILKDPIAALPKDDRDNAEDLTDTVKQNLDKIGEHGKRADSIVKNMLLHSREGPSERQRVDLNALAEEALNLAYHGARAENPDFNIAMTKMFAPEASEVECYPQDLMRVLLNLISNGMYAANKREASAGRKAAPIEPAITVETRDLGDRVAIEVRDNGAGIPADIREKIFIPFFSTKPAGEGTGLGLSLSYDIVVKQHGGTISVASEPDEFTAFVVTVPRVLPDTKTKRGSKA